jgi:hypothetical protein
VIAARVSKHAVVWAAALLRALGRKRPRLQSRNRKASPSGVVRQFQTTSARRSKDHATRGQWAFTHGLDGVGVKDIVLPGEMVVCAKG